MWPFGKKLKEIQPDIIGVRWKEVVQKYPLGSGYFYHEVPVIVVEHNRFFPTLYCDGRIPGVWIEWFDSQNILQNKFVEYFKLQFLRAPAKAEQATNAQQPATRLVSEPQQDNSQVPPLDPNGL